jgi:DNA polymerase/3'-5' exonuclease PolX
MTYTGSVGHNIRLISEAKDRGWQWRPQTGLVIPPLFPDTDAPEIVCVSECDIYARLGIPYLEPADRDAWGAAYKEEGRPA